MSDFAQNFIAGVQAGRQHVQAQADHERQLEELDLKKKLLKHQMNQFELEAKLKQQEHDVKMAEAKQKFFTGADPGNDISNGISGVTGGQSLFEAFAKGGPEARVDTSAMQPVGQNPMVEFPGGGAVRPPTAQQVKMDLRQAFAEQEGIKSENRILENLSRPSAGAATAVVQVVDPDIAQQLGVEVGASVPKGSIDQISDMLTRKRLESGGRPEQYKPVVFIDPQGRTVSRDAVTGRILWTSGEGELRPTDGRIPSVVRESLTGKTDAIQGLNVVEAQLKNPTVQQYMGPIGGRLTLAAAALGGAGIPPEVARAATEIKRLLATQAFAFGGKTLTPTELETYTSLLPQLTDTFPQAVQKWEQARDYLRRSLTNSLATATAAERAGLGQTKAGRRILDAAGWNEEDGPTPSKFGAPPPAAKKAEDIFAKYSPKKP